MKNTHFCTHEVPAGVVRARHLNLESTGRPCARHSLLQLCLTNVWLSACCRFLVIFCCRFLVNFCCRFLVHWWIKNWFGATLFFDPCANRFLIESLLPFRRVQFWFAYEIQVRFLCKYNRNDIPWSDGRIKELRFSKVKNWLPHQPKTYPARSHFWFQNDTKKDKKKWSKTANRNAKADARVKSRAPAIC